MPRALLHVGKHRLEALHEEQQPGWVGRIKFWHCEKYVDSDLDQVHLAVEIQEAPCEVLAVMSSNDPRRSGRRPSKGFAGGVEVRTNLLPSVHPPSSPSRPKSQQSKAKRRPAPPASDSTLARGTEHAHWMAQAYEHSAQGYARATPTTPSGQSAQSMQPLTPSPPHGMQPLTPLSPIASAR